MALIGSWNSTSTLMNFPRVFGVLGYIGGPFFTIVLQGLVYCVCLHIINLVCHYKKLGQTVNCFGDLGQCLYGNIGKISFRVLQ
eukprot:Pgem_evm1s12227